MICRGVICETVQMFPVPKSVSEKLKAGLPLNASPELKRATVNRFLHNHSN